MFPERGAFSTGVRIGDTEFRLRFWWSEKERIWYMDLLSEDRSPIVLGKAVVAGSDPLPGATPVDGVIVFGGRDYDEPSALGRDVSVYVIDRFGE